MCRSLPCAAFAPLVFALLLLAACGEDGKQASPPPPAEAAVVTRAVPYQDGDVALEGFLAKPAHPKGKRPGVLVVHEWWGLAQHPKNRAQRLARLGYVAFCCDMYGKGKLTKDAKQAGAWAKAFHDDPHGFGRARVRAGFDVLRKDPDVDPKRLAVIGFCYGGEVALELAWSGAPVKAAVCFHGTPTLPRPQDVAGVKAAVLVCLGADDAFIPAAKRTAFLKGLEKTTIVHKLESYAGAVHAFTNPDADSYGIPNVKYDKAADEKSWAAMRAWFAKYLD
jgi:dienelactone hydrolase